MQAKATTYGEAYSTALRGTPLHLHTGSLPVSEFGSEAVAMNAATIHQSKQQNTVTINDKKKNLSRHHNKTTKRELKANLGAVRERQRQT